MKQKLFLLADDDNDDAELFDEALSLIDANIKFSRVDNGYAALELLQEGLAPDIIFLDVNLPEMTGWECLQKIRSNDDYKAIPIVIYTTSSSPRDLDKAAQLGATGLITKPSTFKKLKTMLQKIAENFDGNLPDILSEIAMKED